LVSCGLGSHTPQTVHYGLAPVVIAARQKTLDKAFALHPERFVRNPPSHQEVPQQVWINPPKTKTDLQVAPGSTIVAPGDLRAAEGASFAGIRIAISKPAMRDKGPVPTVQTP